MIPSEIHVWDTRYIWGKKAIPKPCESIKPLKNRAFSSICIDSIGSRIFASSSDNHVYAYCTGNYSSVPIQTYSAPGFLCGSFYIKARLDHDDSVLACGSSNNKT